MASSPSFLGEVWLCQAEASDHVPPGEFMAMEFVPKTNGRCLAKEFQVMRFQLEPLIRAAAASANVREIVVIESQAILGSFPDLPERLQQSMDAAVYSQS